MAPTRRRFVEWEERFVSHERGSRVVYYYVKDRNGNAFLAVVGTERSLRHMVYVVSEEFLQLAEVEKCSNNSSFKWRSRREVVDWLTSLLSKPNGDHSKSPPHDSSRMSDAKISNRDEVEERSNYIHNSKGDFSRKPRMTSEDIVWSGTAWTCRKRLSHYPSFCRNGIAISVHAFVYVMAEEKEHHIAYLEDMYEDKKGRKKVRVRWFHKIEEVLGDIPPPQPHSREVFITPFSQVLSAECVDGLTTILTPDHYEKCLAKMHLDVAQTQIHLCFRQCDNDGVKPFNLSELPGYFNQKTIDFTIPWDSSKHDLTSDGLDMDEEEDTYTSTKVRRGPRKCRSSRRRFGVPDHLCAGNTEATRGGSENLHRLTASGRAHIILNNQTFERAQYITGMGKNRTPGRAHEQGSVPFGIGDRVELLCQDSGIRGCWFRCTVIKIRLHQLKVRYEDVSNEDGGNNLEEWVPAFKIAAPDRLGMRISRRPTIRPCPENSSNNTLEVGTAVDAWWNDGWWEGVVVMIKQTVGEVQVYFPDENDCSTFQSGNLRLSRDWVGNQWIDVKGNSDLAASMASFNLRQGASVGCLQSPTLLKDSTSLASSGREDPVDCSDKKVSSGNLLHVNCSERRMKCIEEAATEILTEYPLHVSIVNGICVKSNTSEKSNAVIKQNVSVDISSEQRKCLMDEHGVEHICNAADDGLPSDLKWKSRKRQRTTDSAPTLRAGTSCGKEESEQVLGCKTTDGEGTKNDEQSLLASNTENLSTRQENHEEMAKAKRLRQGHENLKPIHGPSIGSSLFMGSMPIANLVMSR
eukprot:Gb_22692 [translate_table: standard]